MAINNPNNPNENSPQNGTVFQTPDGEKINLSSKPNLDNVNKLKETTMNDKKENTKELSENQEINELKARLDSLQRDNVSLKEALEKEREVNRTSPSTEESILESLELLVGEFNRELNYFLNVKYNQTHHQHFFSYPLETNEEHLRPLEKLLEELHYHFNQLKEVERTPKWGSALGRDYQRTPFQSPSNPWMHRDDVFGHNHQVYPNGYSQGVNPTNFPNTNNNFPYQQNSSSGSRDYFPHPRRKDNNNY